jgi:hypothetical protein
MLGDRRSRWRVEFAPSARPGRSNREYKTNWIERLAFPGCFFQGDGRSRPFELDAIVVAS